ncbi:hypothetical protein ACFQNE_14205 [Gordonia phosphorivorans]|uniref:XRE family transcriptional regulator n=1 Tax=Gordonia phosphorivorans TaxID=1056982 RepID=A0ABV6H7N2_9ACTN
MNTIRLEAWASFHLRRDVTVQECADATGYGSRGQFSKRSRSGELPLNRVAAALEYWADEAAEAGIVFNLTDALIEMGYLPVPIKFRGQPARPDLSADW